MKSEIEALLCIHYYYPPIHSIGVIRNYHISKELIGQSDSHLILTTSNRKVLPSSMDLNIQNLQIQEVDTNDYRTKLASRKIVHLKEEQKKGILSQLSIKLINTYPFNIWIGEGGRLYIQNAIKKGSDFLANMKEPIIYTSFRPYSDIYVAYKLKQKFPNAKWIVDFRDLHVDPMYKNVLFQKQQHAHNKELLTKADLIITVSDGLKEKLDEYSENVLTVYNGCSIRERNIGQKTDQFVITYTGSLFGEHRNPIDFLLFVRSLLDRNMIESKKLQINYAGKDGEMFTRYMEQTGLFENFNNLGVVDRESSLELQRQSHLNLLLTSVSKEMKGVLTGKLFEYIGSLTPTLAVINGGRDAELDSLLGETKSGVCWHVGENNTSAKNWFLSLYQSWKKNTPIVNDAQNVSKYLSWEKAGNQIITAIKMKNA